MPTSAPFSSAIPWTNRMSLRTPVGVTWPHVSQTQRRFAPASIAAPYSARSVSGCARVVSSVTNMTGSPSSVANFTASAASPTIFSSSQFSVKKRIGLEPMNAQTSSGAPISWLISAAGSMSLMTVRHATFGVILIDVIARAISRMWSRARSPAPGRPMFAVSIPSSSIRPTSFSLVSRSGSIALGLWRPSRRVSSSSWMCPKPFGSSAFQSWIRLERSSSVMAGRRDRGGGF